MESFPFDDSQVRTGIVSFDESASRWKVDYGLSVSTVESEEIDLKDVSFSGAERASAFFGWPFSDVSLSATRKCAGLHMPPC